MKVKTLLKRLEGLNIPYAIEDVNGYNKDVLFTINETNFTAGFIEGREEVEDFCRPIYFDQVSQQMVNRFFRNFKELLRYAYI